MTAACLVAGGRESSRSDGPLSVPALPRRPALPQVLQELPSSASDSVRLSPPADGGRAVCHRDAVLAMAQAKASQAMLITGGRDGVVKVWR